ncbi:MAG: SDR family oxidoreductase [Clostridiales bacterium]|nr:SDR family oxidoreductase [Clostridiales bacterium]
MEYQNLFRLDNRTALITGGGSGIGKACAVLLASAGANVVISGRREQKLKEVQAEIRSQGGSCAYYVCDVGEEANCKAMVESCIEHFGRLDIVVNNAGVRGEDKNLEQEFATENLEKTMRVDFDSVFFTTKYAYLYLEKGGSGAIINSASLAALRGSGAITYSAAKGAVRSMGKTLAKKLGSKGIRVNTVYPGLIITEMNEEILNHPEVLKHFQDESPLGLVGAPEDVAGCVLCLASDAARFVTGQDFVIDGGAMC